MNTEMEKYFDIIIEALDRVEHQYYKLETTYEPTGIVRERVFCYELYHQIRCIQTERKETRLSLNGEIDKRGHITFDIDDRKNPDFVFHIPGEMIGNTFVIEVKGTIEKITYINELIKDFHTLTLFVSKYEYKMGIFILYNHTLTEFIEKLHIKLNQKFGSLSKSVKENIFILCKKDKKTKHEFCTLEEILSTNE